MTRLLSFTLAALAGYVAAVSWRHHRSAVREFTRGGKSYDRVVMLPHDGKDYIWTPNGCAETYDD